MRPESDRRANRLISEKSPYLLQHAHNPVDWFPWGEEAFGRAKVEDKPIFLSIGYSACHWCHVMERESFEDPEIARLLNETFVCVKVDREERPDVDDIYMTACQMMTGGGGWPLTIMMTHDRKPFFAATYVPKESMYGRIGMRELILSVEKVWKDERNRVNEIADRVLEALFESPGTSTKETTEDVLRSGFERLLDIYDEEHGGFGPAPKFPTPSRLIFLLRYWKRTGDASALSMAERSLQSMRRGGIWDHIGYGFHRYSVDKAWMVPHFEKMLYDQALLSMAYAEAYLATGKGEYAETLKDTISYVLRDMSTPDGAFISAEDADSEGIEGRFYIWSGEETADLLSAREAEVFAQTFALNCTPQSGARGGETGRRGNLFMRGSYDEISRDIGISAAELRHINSSSLSKLLKARERRIRPDKDDMVLTDWNGLMIAALAKAAQALNDSNNSRAASAAADFIIENMTSPQGRLFHRFREGNASVDGFLEDYAFFVWGLVELYEATFEPKYLKEARDLTKLMIEIFWDEQSASFFSSSRGSEVLVRRKDTVDGATPSGNSVALFDLLVLGRLTGDSEFVRTASLMMRNVPDILWSHLEAHTHLLIALDAAFGPTHEIVIVQKAKTQEAIDMIGELRKKYLPNLLIVLKDLGSDDGLDDLIEITRGKEADSEGATVYLCAGNSCKAPTKDIGRLIQMIEERHPN
ncbi:MAG: thioredoxin domain-containing protein [Methanomassiliicoccales archaeon]|nr:thioredoxin domain-containing protein [Methanomassiliicoccales archaeon]